MELMRCERLTVEYPGFALRDVNLHLAPGERLCLLGESGSGKSTLLRALACLLGADARVQGRVFFRGAELLSMPERARRDLRMTALSVCPQGAQQWLNPSLTLSQHLSEILARRHPRREHGARAALLMARVGLDEADLARYPRELSGGMAQRFLFACAIALTPALVLLDEPTASLDECSRARLAGLIRELSEREGTAFLIATHDVPFAAALCPRALVLYDGEIVEEAPTEQLLAAPRHPYARALLRSVIALNPYRDLWGIRPARALPAGERCRFYGRCTQSIARCASFRPPLSQAGPGRLVACHRGGVVKALSARGICKRFGDRQVLAGAGIEVYAGEVVALTGPSGSGKSTLCAILAGYLAADAGEVVFDGCADARGARARQGGLQLVMQDGAGALNPRLSVLEALSEPLLLAGADEALRRARAGQALRGVDLPAEEAFLARRVAALSGGQKQRLNLARALTMSPSLLIADEPTAMLDASSMANLLRTLKGLQHERGCALLLVTHDLEAARKVADRVYQMQGGLAVQTPAPAPQAVPASSEGENMHG